MSVEKTSTGQSFVTGTYVPPDASEENKVESSQIKKNLDEYLKQVADLQEAYKKLQEQGLALFKEQIGFAVKAPTDIAETCRKNAPVSKGSD